MNMIILCWIFTLYDSVVNGALEYLARDLGITENTVLQGMQLDICEWFFIFISVVW